MAQLSLEKTAEQNRQLSLRDRDTLAKLQTTDMTDDRLTGHIQETDVAHSGALERGIGRQADASARLLLHLQFEAFMRGGGNPSEFGAPLADGSVQDFSMEELEAVSTPSAA